MEGLTAKPTVDILVELMVSCDTDAMVQTMKENGYIYSPQPNNPPPHMMFLKGYTEEGFAEKVFHVHIRYSGDWDELYFCEYLRRHPDVAKQYCQLKTGLKEKFEHDRDAYTHAKTEFVKRVTKLARQEMDGK